MAQSVVFIQGGGIGFDQELAVRRILTAAGVEIDWQVFPAGQAALAQGMSPLPLPLLDAVRSAGVALKTKLLHPPHPRERAPMLRRLSLISALGATAVEGLLGVPGGITKLRGHWREFRGVPVMPTYHPAYLLRNEAPGEKRKVWEDMLQVLEKLGRPISTKQRNYFLNR